MELVPLRTAIQEIQAAPLRTLRRSNAAVGELATTLDSRSLIYWVEKVCALPLPQLPMGLLTHSLSLSHALTLCSRVQLGTEEGTETYAELALLTNDALSDSSVVSVYGFNASAHFCQHLGRTNPFIFDWLLEHSTAEERVQFRSIMNKLTLVFAQYGRPGVMAKLVDEQDIGPLLLWTTLASEHQVRAISVLLARARRGGWSAYAGMEVRHVRELVCWASLPHQPICLRRVDVSHVQ